MPTAEQIYQALDEIMQAGAALPQVDLLPGERMVLSGSLFEEAPAFVLHTAEALAGDRALFADVPIDPRGLLDQQRRALAAQALARGLRALAAQAEGLYLTEQAAAVRQALAAVYQVRSDAARPFPDARLGRRRDALWLPEQILARRQRRKQEVARRRRSAPRAETAPPPRAETAPPPRPSPQAAAVRVAVRVRSAQIADEAIARLRPRRPAADAPASPRHAPSPICADPAAAKKFGEKSQTIPGTGPRHPLDPAIEEAPAGADREPPPRGPASWKLHRRIVR